MHGTSEHSTGRHRLCLLAFITQVFVRVAFELRLASGRTEIPDFACMLAAMLCGMGVYQHPADRVFYGMLVVVFRSMMIVLVFTHSVLLFCPQANQQKR